MQAGLITACAEGRRYTREAKVEEIPVVGENRGAGFENLKSMIDSYNREINYLRVSVTDRCNLRCIYCMPKEGLSVIGHDDILRYEEILRVICASIQLGIAKVRVTGGEPLVRRGILDFLSKLKTIDGLQDVSLTTNGVLLESMAEGIFKAGIRRINISLDSLNQEKYECVTRGGSLERVLRGIDEAHRAGFSPIKINIVVIKGFNDDEILSFARQTIDKPYQIRFIELMPLGRVGMDYEEKYLSNDTILDEIAKAYPLVPVNVRKTNLDGPAMLFRIKDARGEIGFISAMSQHFCQSCNRLRLTADGNIRACLFSDQEVDLKSKIRMGCSDSDLVRLIKIAAEKKPRGFKETADEGHIKKCTKDMSAIGG
jgi:GTP 3',8-cyclase